MLLLPGGLTGGQEPGTAWHLLDESEQPGHLSAAGCPWVRFSSESGRERGMTGFFRYFFSSAPAWVYLSQLSILVLTKDPLKFASSWQLHPGALPSGAEWDHCPHPRCSSCLGERPKCSHTAPGGNFPAGNKGIVRSHCCPRRPFRALVLGGCKSSSRQGNPISERFGIFP